MEYTGILIILAVCVLSFFYLEMKQISKFNDRKDRLLFYTTSAIMLVGVVARVVWLQYPYGINVDEAANGYDSWCLAHYGVDQYLYPYPVYLKSWGSGQTALYAYLAAPFIKLCGLSAHVHRLPMAIISSFTVLFFYWSLRKTGANKLLVATLVLMLALSPWHIMNGRWALDCNIAPNLCLIGVCCILLGSHAISGRRLGFYVAGCISFVLTAYGYGVSWFMLPILYLGVFVLLFKRKKIEIKQAVICLGVTALVAFPLILFAINVFFGQAAYQLGPITIPELVKMRHDVTTLFGSDDVLGYISNNIRKGIFLLVWGTDGTPHNAMRFWGQFYNVVGIPLILYRFYTYIRQRSLSLMDAIFLVWLISCLPILLIVEIGVFHWNMIWIPLVYFSGKGMYSLIHRFKKLLIPVYAVIICFAGMFFYEYFNYYHPKQDGRLWFKISGFEYGLQEPIDFIYSLDKVENRYFARRVNTIYCVLFYHPVSPYTFEGQYNKTTIIGVDLDKEFFFDGNPIPHPKTAYLIPNDEAGNVPMSEYKIKRFDHYTVVWNE